MDNRVTSLPIAHKEIDGKIIDLKTVNKRELAIVVDNQDIFLPIARTKARMKSPIKVDINRTKK